MKRKFIPLIIILVTALFGMSACTLTKENKPKDARNIAVNKFGCNKVWNVSSGTKASTLLHEKTSRYIYYVLGIKDGKEIFIIVPALKDDDAYEIEWPFVKPFTEIVERLNAAAGDTICTESNYEQVVFVDTDFNQYDANINVASLDVRFMIVFDQYSIVQINGEIVINKCK